MTDFRATTLGEIAAWAATTPPIGNPTAQERARAAFEDTLACMIAGADDPAALAAFTGSRTPGPCTAVGHAETVPAEAAALTNATAAHALDFDDNFLPAVTHASAVMVPALVALGEETGASGAALLDAYVIGLELQAWLGRLLGPEHYAAGWHATSTIGGFGCAAACARLLKLDGAGMLNALSLAASMAAGSKVQFGTMAKPLHAGLAARAGISAARLAAAGMEADPDPIFGDWGMRRLYGADMAREIVPPEDLAIITDGLAQKRFPCCASAHRTLDAIVALKAEHGFQAGDIAGIETTVPRSNARNLRFDDPANEKEARFSMTYCAALAALHGTVALADFTPEAIRRPHVRAFMGRVRMLDAGPESDTGAGIWETPAETVITLADGRVLREVVAVPVGTIGRPLARADIEAKLADCTSGRLPPAEAATLAGLLRDFGGADVRALAPLLREVVPRSPR